jgi:hypothetical protein
MSEHDIIDNEQIGEQLSPDFTPTPSEEGEGEELALEVENVKEEVADNSEAAINEAAGNPDTGEMPSPDINPTPEPDGTPEPENMLTDEQTKDFSEDVKKLPGEHYYFRMPDRTKIGEEDDLISWMGNLSRDRLYVMRDQENKQVARRIASVQATPTPTIIAKDSDLAGRMTHAPTDFFSANEIALGKKVDGTGTHVFSARKYAKSDVLDPRSVAPRELIESLKTNKLSITTKSLKEVSKDIKWKGDWEKGFYNLNVGTKAFIAQTHKFHKAFFKEEGYKIPLGRNIDPPIEGKSLSGTHGEYRGGGQDMPFSAIIGKQQFEDMTDLKAKPLKVIKKGTTSFKVATESIYIFEEVETKKNYRKKLDTSIKNTFTTFGTRQQNIVDEVSRPFNKIDKQIDDVAKVIELKEEDKNKYKKFIQKEIESIAKIKFNKTKDEEFKAFKKTKEYKKWLSKIHVSFPNKLPHYHIQSPADIGEDVNVRRKTGRYPSSISISDEFLDKLYRGHNGQ